VGVKVSQKSYDARAGSKSAFWKNESENENPAPSANF